jgi:selenocysteine lyase/cysteine desulfurase
VNVTVPQVEGVNQIQQAVQEALKANPDVKLCIFSHISSVPAMIEPVEELTRLAHSFNALVLIDGAHAPGQITVDVSDIAPDFYLGNCHKWLYSPKGTAFLWVAPSQQTLQHPEPTVISSSGDQTFLGRYKYTGTRDYTAFSSVPSALAFVDLLGGHDQIYAYNHGLAKAVAAYLTSAWQTSLLVGGLILPLCCFTSVTNDRALVYNGRHFVLFLCCVVFLDPSFHVSLYGEHYFAFHGCCCSDSHAKRTGHEL